MDPDTKRRFASLTDIRKAVDARNKWLQRHVVPSEPGKPLPELPDVVALTAVVEPASGYQFSTPNPVICLEMGDSPHHVIGSVSFSVSPLLDCTYVDDIEINVLRRKGYGMAIVRFIIEKVGLPVRPVQDTSGGFWEKLLQYSCPSFPVLEAVSVSEYHLESLRWSHLFPAIEAHLRALALHQNRTELQHSDPLPDCVFCDAIFQPPAWLGIALRRGEPEDDVF